MWERPLRAQVPVAVALSGFLSRKRKYADKTRGRLRQKDYRNKITYPVDVKEY